jgi:membrane associated rhomboid family serine protease
MQQGQWWRLITALTLHADLVHLVGNCIIGGFMVHQLSRTTGYGLSWVLLLASGALANLLNVAFRADGHLSVGFSTAVFSAIGIFCGLQIRRKKGLIHALLLPIGAGVSLLALLGAEGGRTDLGAHFFGLGVGIVMGLCTKVFQLTEKIQTKTGQTRLFILAVFMVGLVWVLALRAPSL